VILVTGATGTIGQALVARLGELTTDFRAASRTGRGTRLVEHVQMDFAQPDSVTAALRAVDVLFLNSTQVPDMAVLQGAVVEAARRAEVRHIVKVSGGTPITGPDKPSWVGRSHAEIEARIVASGIDWTFLRPAYFMQNLLRLSPSISRGTLPVPLADQRLAIVDARDIAAVAAAILIDPTPHAGRIYDITGPEALDFATVADRLSQVVGTRIVHVAPPLDAVVAQLAASGAPTWQQRHLREAMSIFAIDPRAARVSDAVVRITARPPRSLERFVTDHRDAIHQGRLP
jgi:uncharacterized protein YbjT (DUF2867 family)